MRSGIFYGGYKKGERQLAFPLPERGPNEEDRGRGASHGIGGPCGPKYLPPHSAGYALATSMVFVTGPETALRGMVTRNTPFLCAAVMPSASASSGSRKTL